MELEFYILGVQNVNTKFSYMLLLAYWVNYYQQVY